jgi:hypothetical protein
LLCELSKSPTEKEGKMLKSTQRRIFWTFGFELIILLITFSAVLINHHSPNFIGASVVSVFQVALTFPIIYRKLKKDDEIMAREMTYVLDKTKYVKSNEVSNLGVMVRKGQKYLLG